jgi:hypothetical protein
MSEARRERGTHQAAARERRETPGEAAGNPIAPQTSDEESSPAGNPAGERSINEP